MSETGEEKVASWLNPPSYAPDATENAELPWTLKPPPPPPVEPPGDPDFVVVPRDGKDARKESRVEAKGQSSTSDHWSIRESERKPEPIVIPINEALIPKPPPSPLMRRAAIALQKRWDHATPRQRLGVTTGVAAIVAGVLVGALLNTVFAPARQNSQLFPEKIYHVPQLLGGIGIASAPSAQAIALQDGLTPLAPPNSHAEVADYAGPAGNIYYELALVQDNLGRNTMRFDSDLASQFPNLDSQTQVDKTANGITISCGTVLNSSSSYQGCTWYSSFAFGAYIDNVATSPAQALSTLLPTLQHMTSLTTTRSVNAS
jgi:hypothetical protein